MTKLLSFLALVILAVSILPAAPAMAGPTSLRATLTGMNEAVPVSTMAQGEAVFTLSGDGLTLTYVLIVSNITDAKAAHIHLAPPGINGPVVVGLFGGLQPGPFSGVLAQGTITAANLGGALAGMPLSALISEINAGNAYVNVHTTANPGGEIRGQINPG